MACCGLTKVKTSGINFEPPQLPSEVRGLRRIVCSAEARRSSLRWAARQREAGGDDGQHFCPSTVYAVRDWGSCVLQVRPDLLPNHRAQHQFMHTVRLQPHTDVNTLRPNAELASPGVINSHGGSSAPTTTEHHACLELPCPDLVKEHCTYSTNRRAESCSTDKRGGDAQRSSLSPRCCFAAPHRPQPRWCTLASSAMIERSSRCRLTLRFQRRAALRSA